MFKNIGWTLGNDCPCKCRHCYSANVREKGANLSKEIVDKVIEEIMSVGAETINFGGNEPIFTNGLNIKKSFLPYIIDECTKKGLKIGITSAGPSIIALEKNYNDSFKKLNDIDISIDSPIPEEHNLNRGADVFDMAIESLNICNKYEIPHTLVMCAMKWNFTIDRISKLVDLAKKYNANIRINMFKPIEKRHIEMMPTIKQVIEGYDYLVEHCYTLDMSDPVLSAKYDNLLTSGCSCGINSLRINSITPEGEISVSPCVYMHHFKVGNILKEPLLKIIASDEFKKFNYRKENYSLIKGCENCSKGSICRGGCAASAYWYNYHKNGRKEILSKDPYCIIDEDSNIEASFKKGETLVHENYLCTWIGKAK